jgi:hypothetical protein
MRSFVIFALTLVMAGTQAQNLKVNFGQLLPSDRRTEMLDAGIMGDKIFVIEKEKKTLSIKFYNASNLKFLSSKIIQQNNCKGSNDCISNDFGYEKTIWMKDNILMVFSSFERSSKQNTLFVQKINAKGNFEVKFTIIDKIQTESRRNTGSFRAWQSQDSTKFMVIQIPPYEKYNNEKFGFKVYNSNLDNISNFSVSLPYKDKNVSVSDYYLGNDGTIYMLVHVEKEKQDREKGQDLSFYSILTLKGKDGALSEYVLKLPNRDIETVALRLDDKTNKIICCGLYSDITKGYSGNKIDGLFYLKVDVNNKGSEISGFKSIDNSVLAEILDVKEEKIDKKAKAASASKNFEIMDILPMKDGTTKLITEYRLLTIVSVTSCDGKGNCTTTYEYHYYRKNIFVISIDKDGTILNFTDIPKYQHTVNDGGRFSSFLLCQKDDRIYFLFNDNPLNLNVNIKSIKDVKMMSRVNKACVVSVQLNKDGSYTKQKVYDVSDKKIAMLPESGIKISEGQYIIPIQQAPKGFNCACLRIFSKAKTGISKIVL